MSEDQQPRVVTEQSDNSKATQDLSFEFRNISKQPAGELNDSILYLADNAEDNRCQLTIRGNPVAFDQESMIYLSFGIKLQQNFHIGVPPRWEAKFHDDDLLGDGGSWHLRYLDIATISLQLVIDISNVRISETEMSEGTIFLKIKTTCRQPSKDCLPVMLSKKRDGFPDLRAISTGLLTLPSNNVYQPMQLSLFTVPSKQRDEVYINQLPDELPILSRLRFYISNVGSSAVRKEAGSRFQIDFAKGDPEVKEDSRVTCSFVGSNTGSAWRVDRLQGTTGSWKLTPPPHPTEDFFKPGEVVTIDIYCRFLADDWLAGASAIYLSYFDFPGHQNGMLQFPLQKVAVEPTVLWAKCEPSGIVSEPSVALLWQMLGAVPLLRIRALDGSYDTFPMLIAGVGAVDLTKYKNTARLLTLGPTGTGPVDTVAGWVRYQ